MNFGFSEEQELLRSEVRKFLDENAAMDEVRKATEDEAGPGFSRELWRQVAELGWAGLTVPEAHGGAGLGWVDLVVVLEETGRSLFPSPLVATTLATHAIGLAGSDEQQARLLPRLADGSSVGTVALAESDDVPGPEGVRLEASRSGEGVVLSGEKLGSETSVNKLHRAELEVELGELALEIQGSRGPLAASADEVADGGQWQRMALGWPEVVIGGGTPNIQKNIIAERILGLPKDV